MGGPADVVISLASYTEHADPLLLVSTAPHSPRGLDIRAPSEEKLTIEDQHASSVDQWRDDAPDNHYVMAEAIPLLFGTRPRISRLCTAFPYVCIFIYSYERCSIRFKIYRKSKSKSLLLGRRKWLQLRACKIWWKSVRTTHLS